VHVVSFVFAEMHRSCSSHQIFSRFLSAYHKFQSGLTTRGRSVLLQLVTNEACADQGLTGTDCELYLKGLGPQIRAAQAQISGVQAQISSVQQQQQAQGCLNPPAVYDIIDLGRFGDSDSGPLDINNNGQVVGRTFAGGNAFLWSMSTGMQDLGVRGSANSINNVGQVAGDLITASGTHAFFWSTSTGVQDLGTLGGNSSGAYAINDNGQVVGPSQYSIPPYFHAFLWSATTGMKDLTPLDPLGNDPSDINNQGQIVGGAGKASPIGEVFKAYLWSESSGFQYFEEPIHFTAINDLGQAIGWMAAADNLRHAFLWSTNAGFVDLGTLSGSWTVPRDINNKLQIVGEAEDKTLLVQSRAFLWSTSTGMIDLNSLIPTNSGWSLNYARSINDSGYIVGFGTYKDDPAHEVLHGFLLTPP
jgi:probable HAF family extracellular repeat protein